VTCPKCGYRAPADFQFCPKCATALAPSAVTSEGGTQAMLSHAIQRLIPKEYAERLLATRGQPHDQRRTVTILFSDVKGSTAMAEKLDPEDVKDVMHGVFEFLIGAVYRYEGTLGQVVGDAILAFFGAPIAHEDDPERACRAALEITAEAQRYAEKLKVERGIEGFNVRVGINTGLVVMGELGSDLRVEYTAVGDAINLAARMEQNAEPGTVLITEATHKLIARLFETLAMPALQVKGKGEPVAVHRVLAAKAAAGGKARGIAGLESPLVGREAELGALQEALERLKAGVGGIVTIVGEAGLGKSRLVAEARETRAVIVEDLAGGSATASPYSGAAISPAGAGDCFGRVAPRHDGTETTPRNDREVRWAEGRCLSYGTSMAYLLWLDVLRGLLGVTVEDAPQQVGEKLQERVTALCGDPSETVLPYLARLLSLPLDGEAESQLRDLDGQQLKAGTFDAIEALLLHAANKRPLVVVCEDLHWADPTSLELLERALTLTDHASLLLICLFRPDPAHGSWLLRETVRRSYGHRHTDLELRPLSAADSQALVGNLLQAADLTAELRQRIIGAAEGNPLFVEEVIRGLMDADAIVRDEATGRVVVTRRVADMVIPDTLQGVLVARLDRLTEDTKRVLQMAAVIGRIFLYRVLTAIAQEERQLDQHLLTLQRQELIRERARIPELEYIFKHELTRDAAYNGLLKKERRAFHRQVAEALERLFVERIEEQLGLLAYHWESADDAAKATAYLLRAGDQARLAYAHQEAIDYYQRALRFLEKQDADGQAARTWMKLGLTYHTVFDFQRSREAYNKGFLLWQRAGQEPRAIGAPADATLRVGVAQPLTLDPSQCIDTDSAAIIGQLFSALVRFTPELDIMPDAARSWEIADGGRTYVFHLRDDLHWSDRRPVTAGDFLFGFQRIVTHAKAMGGDVLWSDIEGVRAYLQNQSSDLALVGVHAPDDATLIVALEEPTSYMLQLLSLLYPVPRHTVETHAESWIEPANIVTNGPFLLQAHLPGKLLILQRNPNYHGRLSGNVQRVEAHILPFGSTGHLEAYARGELDAACILWEAPTQVERLSERYAGEYVSAPELWALWMGFDITRPPFDDTRVRRAFAMALDREALAREMGSYASPATGGVVPPGIPGYSPGSALPHNLQMARDLLAEAGYGAGQRFPQVELWYPIRSAVAAPVEWLINLWRQGLDVEICVEAMEWAPYLDRLAKGLPQVWALCWQADYPDPDNFLRAGLGAYRGGWPRQPYEEVLERARHITDQPERMRLYRQAEQMVVDEALVVPLTYANLHYLVKPWVKRYPLSSVAPPFWKDVVIEPH
jgi:ABC-type oligopeptide transport system substrate-binding subunit/class 3 adenylate cyclase